MDEKQKGELKKLAELTRDKIGENENSVKYKFIIPFLGCFGHVKLDFEHPSQGSRIDILIGNKSSCGIVVETKSYDKNLDKYLPQLKGYCDEKRPLLAIIANGEEIRAYSPLWRISNFSETILYSIKRNELSSDEIIERLEKLLSKENLENEKLDDHILERENEIKSAKKEIKSLIDTYKNNEDNILNEIQLLKDKINEINIQISEKDKKILDSKKKKEQEIRKLKDKYRLPIIEPKPIIVQPNKDTKVPKSMGLSPDFEVKEGDKIEIFANHKRELYKATYYSQNKIIYNGIVYTSPSAACMAITKTSCNGWVFWKFKDENGKEYLLSELRKQKKN